MPITQDRLINLVAYCDTLLEAMDHIRTISAKVNVPELMILTNAANARVDAPTAQLLQHLMANIVMLQELSASANVPQTLRDDISAERIHFKKHRKSNEYMARYALAKRSRTSEQAESQRQMPVVFTNLPAAQAQAPTTTSSEPTWNTQEVVERTLREFEANPAAYKPVPQQAPKVDSGEIAYPAGYDPHNIIPPGETGIPIAEAQELMRQNELRKNPRLKPTQAKPKPEPVAQPIITTSVVIPKDPDLLYSSKPSDDELYKLDPFDGKDPLA